MRLRRIGTDRLNRLTSTGSLLATLLLSPSLYAHASDAVDATVDSAQPTESEPAQANEDADSDLPDTSPTNAHAYDTLLKQIKAQLDQVKSQIEFRIEGFDDLAIDPHFDDPEPPAAAQADEDEPIDQPDPAEPAADVASLIEAEKQRAKAEALIAQLADVDEGELGGLEAALAELGKASLVPLKLAALSDDFVVRTRAGAMARRLRWRLVCSDALLDKYPDLTSTMAGEATRPRREMIEALISEPQADDLPVFVECLADRDPYIRERGIDGLVLIGKHIDKTQAGRALQEAALRSDDKSVVLLSVAGLGEIKQFDIPVLTMLFDQTEHAEVQRTVLMTAGYSRKPEAIDLIERALKDPRWRVRAAGLEALTDISRNADKGRIASIITPLLTDPEPFLRANALRLIADIKLPGAARQIWALMDDGSIDQSTGLETLASLQDGKAYATIRSHYDTAHAASDHEDAARWLTLLGEYEKNTSVDALLKAVIQDETRREQWAVAIYIASRRSDQNYVSLVAPLLLDKEHEIRTTVWNNFGRYDMDEYALPEAIDQGLAKGDTEQRTWRVQLIYQQADINTDRRLYDALGDDDPAVVNLALAMIGKLLISDSLGVDDLPYRSESTHYSIDHFGNEVPRANSKPALTDAAADKLRATLAHKDPLARVRAAALLYHLDKYRGEKVTALLKEAIRSGAPGRIATGLFAARAEHGELLEGVDLIELSQKHSDPYLLENLCSVMLQVGDQALIDAVIVIAEDIAIYQNQEFFVALAATKAEPAIELIKRKLVADGGYSARRFIAALAKTDPDAAIEIGSAMLESKTLSSYDRRDILSTLIRTKQNDKLIPLLNDAIKTAQASPDEYERRQAQQYQQLLLQIDPAVAEKQIIAALQTGTAQEQSQAIRTLIQISKPDKKIVEMVLQTVLKREAEVDPSWGILVGWLTQAGHEAELKAAIDRLPGPMQSALLADMSRDAGPEDLERLLAITPVTPAVRDRITMLVADLTTKHPEIRPTSLDGYTSVAKVYLLAAAGQWEDGEVLLRGRLDDEDPAVAAAALRGLAIARILDTKQTLTDDEADRLSKGVESKDGFTAYLAVEALMQLDRERLFNIDTQKITSRLALLRIGSANGGSAGPVQQAIESVTRNPHGSPLTELRFAMLASIQAENQPAFISAWQAGQRDYVQRDLMSRALEKFQSNEILLQAVYMGTASSDDPDVLAMVERFVAENKGKPNMHLGMYLDRGLIKTVPTDQIEKYLSSLASWTPRGRGMLDDDGLLDMLGRDDPAVQAELQKIMASDSPAALHAAQLLYLLNRDDAAVKWIKDSVTKIDPAQVKLNGLTRHQSKALTLLSFIGDASDTQALIDLHNKLDREDWQSEMLANRLISIAMMIDPKRVQQELRKAQQADDQADHEVFDEDPFAFADLLGAMMIDDADDADAGAAQQAHPDQMVLTTQLRAIKQGGEPISQITSPPWGYYGNIDSEQTISAEELAQLERELTMAWIRTGQYDNEKAQVLQEASYIFQDGQPVFMPLAHEQRMLRFSGHQFESAGVIFNDPASVDTPSYYAALDYTYAPTLFSASRDEAIQQFAPLLKDEDAAIASRAVRVAAVWRATELRGPLVEAIARPDGAGQEAAWASARLFGPGVIDAVLVRAKASASYDERVEFACLLTLLGESQWAGPILDRARRLLAIQQLRGRAIEPVQVFSAGNRSSIGNDPFDNWQYQRRSYTITESIMDGRLAGSAPRWEGLLSVVSDAPGTDALSRRLELLPLPYAGYDRDPDRSVKDVGQPLKLRLEPDIGLYFAPGATNNLPILELVGEDAPLVMHLERQESNLFAGSLTQLAQDGLSGRGLELAWQQWLDKHAGDNADALWRAGVVSATQALTDTRWWRRALAHERLQRLTGQAIEQPALFDSDQWASLRQQWQAWAESSDGSSARDALGSVALKAGLIDAAPANEAEELSMLIRMAGWGSTIQSNAALHRLELWPDPAALVKAAEPWQTSPRPALRAWYLHRATDQPRIYVPADTIE